MPIVDLTRFFDALQRLYPAGTRDQVRELLIVGPGRYEVCVDLLTLFPRSRLTAIDINPAVIEHLADRLSEYGERVHTVTGNAADLPEAAPGPYNLVVIRHPDVARASETWQKAITACASEMSAGGMLVVTTYSLPEASFVDRAAEALPLTMRSGSPYTAIPVALQGNDRYILAYELERP
jgi:spermidine synthase